MNTTGIAPLALLLSIASPSAADVLVVDDDGGPGVDHTTLQGAIDAAGPGDLVLIRPGVYYGPPSLPPAPTVVVGKSLAILADGPLGSVVVQGLAVQALPAGGEIVLQGLDLGDGALLIDDCAGTVWVEDVRGLGQNFVAKEPPVQVTNSAAVHLNRCELRGPQSLFGGFAALVAVQSTISAYDCTFEGADGYVVIQTGGDGARITGGFLFASGSSFLGGANGCAGDGLEVAGNATVVLRDDLLAPGQLVACSVPAQQGVDLRVLSGSVQELAGEARSLSIDSPVLVGNPTTLHYQGEPGDLVVLGIGTALGSLYVPPFGTLQTAVLATTSFLLGTAGPTGALDTTFTLQAIGSPGLVLPLQAAALTGAGLVTTGGTALAILTP